MAYGPPICASRETSLQYRNEAHGRNATFVH
jgi:hypothetical protein